MRVNFLSMVAMTLFFTVAFASSSLSENLSCSDLQNKFLAAKRMHKQLSRAADATNDAEALERIIPRMRDQTSRMISAVYMMRDNGCALPNIHAE